VLTEKNGSRLAGVKSTENEEKNLVTGKSSRLSFLVLLPPTTVKTAAFFYVATLHFMISIKFVGY
jgi:hypothetical protein